MLLNHAAPVLGASVAVLFMLLGVSPSGRRSDVGLPLHETLRRGGAVQASPRPLPPPHVQLQRLQWPVPPPRLLASPSEGPERLWSFLWHLHPAHPDTTAAPTQRGKQLPGDTHVVWAFVSSQLPASSSLLLLHLLLLPSSLPPGCHLHLTKSSPPSPPPEWAPFPVSAHGGAALSQASTTLSHAHANERLTMLEGEFTSEGGWGRLY